MPVVEFLLSLCVLCFTFLFYCSAFWHFRIRPNPWGYQCLYCIYIHCFTRKTLSLRALMVQVVCLVWFSDFLSINRYFIAQEWLKIMKVFCIIHKLFPIHVIQAVSSCCWSSLFYQWVVWMINWQRLFLWITFRGMCFNSLLPAVLGILKG